MITPAVTTAIPITDIRVISSCPSIAAPTADTAGIRAEKMFVLVIPRSLMAFTQKKNATQEQSTAKESSGTITSLEKSVLFTPSRPHPRKNGRKNAAPITNWYVVIVS